MTDFPKDDIVVLVNRDGMGQADAELSHKLFKTWLNMLDLDDRLPRTICFYAEGARMACTGSPVLEELASLTEKGVELIVCTTCLNHYGILDSLAVGTAGGMKEIVEAQWSAGKVLTL